VAGPVRLAEVVGSLALATDLGTGQPLEHAIRTAVVAVRLGEQVGADETDLTAAYYASLLHSAGCTSDAHEAARLYGDDIAPRAAFAAVDARRPQEVLRFVLRYAGAGAPPLRRAAALAAALAEGPRRPRRAFAVHCEVAQRLAGRLGLGEQVVGALGFVFERWDGRGFPAGARGDAIPLPARLLHVARDASVFGRDAPEVLRARAGEAYDPALAAALAADGAGLLEAMETSEPWAALLEAEPGSRPGVEGERLDDACAAIADFVDLKSPWLLGHSRGVAELAEAAAWRLRLPREDVELIRRAGLVHDLGRVAVSNAVWDREAPLRLGEWELVRLHPHYTERAFAPSALAPVGELAALHHERVDGSGYHRRLRGDLLGMPARLLAAADAYHAMTEARPHRPALEPEQAAAELRADAAARRLDADAAEIVLAAAGHAAERPRRRPDGLSEREVEVLVLLARGLTNRQMAERLHVSPKTVGHHVEHIYTKLRVSSRAAAALYAAEEGLLD